MKFSALSAVVALLIVGMANAAPTKNNERSPFLNDADKFDTMSLSDWLPETGAAEEDEPSSPARSSMDSASSAAAVPDIRPTQSKSIGFPGIYDDAKDLAHAENYVHLSAYLQSTDTGIYRDNIQIEIVMQVYEHLMALVDGPESERAVHQEILSYVEDLCELWSQIRTKPEKYKTKRLIHKFLMNVS
jgi:hypothetical protein